MKRISTGLISLLSLILPFIATAASETYVLDPEHTYVQWGVSHFGFSTVSGKWMANGTLELDEANPQNSKLNVEIPLSNIATGIPILDERLKSNLFFDVAKYPTATFVSDKIERTGKKTAKVHGTLTLHGVSKPVTLSVVLNKEGMHPYAKKKALGFSAKTTVKRSDFGISLYADKGVSDTVNIEIEAEAEPKTAEAKAK